MLHLSVSNAVALPSDPNFTGPHIPEPSHFAISQGVLCSKSSVIGLKLLIPVHVSSSVPLSSTGLAGDSGWKNCSSSFGAERQRRNGQPRLSFQNLIADPNPSLASSDFSSYNDQRQKAKTWDPQARTKFSTLDMQPLERAFVFLKAVPQRQTSAFKL